MTTRVTTLLFALCFIAVTASSSSAQDYASHLQKYVDEHIYKGMPGYDNIYIRQAYILSYNHEHRIPNWVAYHVKPGYTNTAPEYGIFSFLRTDRNIPNPVQHQEYQKLKANEKGYIPGRLAPFGISGGDRDGDKLLSVADVNRDGVVDKKDMIGRDLSAFINDADEVSRIYEINQLSNTAPQHADGFRGDLGIWKKLERYIQEKIVKDQQKEVWVIAGTILGKRGMQKVGPNKDITVPPMFYKIVVRHNRKGTPSVLAFLLPHHKVAHGKIEDYLVSVDIIESLSGLDFFRELDDLVEKSLEETDTWANWNSF